MSDETSDPARIVADEAGSAQAKARRVMDADELAAIRERLAATTPEPWGVWEADKSDMPTVYMQDGKGPSWSPWSNAEYDGIDIYERRKGAMRDATFIAHAPADLRALLSENAALREIAQAVAEMNADLPAYGDSGPAFCVFDCDGIGGNDFYTDPPFIHKPDCPFTKARALLAVPQTTRSDDTQRTGDE